MSIAHVCSECGCDLARTRPVRDPHYGLPLVSCPRCGRIAVRQRHPVTLHWRQTVRIVRALLTLIVQSILLIAFATFNTVAAIGVVASLDHNVTHKDRPYIAIFYVIAVGVLPLTIGTWLTVGFSHLRWWLVWIGWALLIGVIVGLVAFIGELGPEFAPPEFAPRSFYPGRALNAADIARLNMRYIVLPAWIVIAVMMVVASGGRLIGKGVLWGWSHYRRSNWRRRRKRLRLARSGG